MSAKASERAKPAAPAPELGPGSEGLLRSALAAARVGTWEWDVRTNRVTCSDWVGPLYGLPMGQAEQQYDGFIGLVHPGDRERVVSEIQRYLRGEVDHYEVEHRVVWPDGSLHWIEIRGQAYHDASGAPLYMAGTVADATRRKLAEQKLVASEALLRQLIAHTPAAVAMLDRDLCYLQTSQRWLSDYGLDGQVVIGRSHYEVFPDVPERWREVHRRVLGGAVERCDEDPFVRADGSMEWLQWEVRPWRDASGEVAGLIMFTQVITERKRTALEAARLARDLSERMQELRNSEDRFRSALQHSPIGMAIVAQDGGWLEVNPALCKILGYTSEELLRTNFQAITHPDDLANDLDNVARMLARRISDYALEKRYIHKDGHVIFAQLNVSLVWNPDGTPRHFISQIQDITKRKQVEQALRKAEEKFSSVFLAAPVGFSITRVADGQLVDANRELGRQLGYRRTELLGRSTLELGLWAEPAQRERLVSMTADSGGVESFELTLRRKDGRLLPVSVSTHAMLIDGEPHMLSALLDLSERKRAETVIQASEARLRRVIASSILGIAFGSSDGAVHEANDEYLRIVGHTREELNAGGLNFWKLAAPEHQALSQKALREVTATGTARPWEMELLTREGGRVPVLIGLSAIDDERRNGVAFVFDLSERRALERQLQHAQRLEAVGRLAAGIAHDFNNVLAAITMSSELLRDSLAPGHPGMDEVLEIRKAAERAVRLIRQLLAFSRQQVLAPRVLDLNELVANLQRMLVRLVGEDVQIVAKFGAGLGAVRADPGQLEQVIVNLAVNARDAMPGGGSLTIETANLASSRGRRAQGVALAPGPHVVLSVTDTGTGMDSPTKGRIFEPFFTTKEQGKGTGLGLSTVYGIVRQSGGAIDVVSEPGQGSTFRIFLPVVDAAVESVPASVPDAIGGSETVLVVEDDTAVRQVTRKTLVRLGYRVLDAPNPATARELVDVYVGGIDVLLTDLIMPGGSGHALADELRALRPKLRVLYMSGYTDGPALREGSIEPGCAYIQKPFSSSALANKLRALLDLEAEAY